jgi:hypothetical protein
MTNSTTGENLVRMIRIWNELAKKPSDLAFTKTLYRDLQILDQVIAEHPGLKKLNRWQKGLVADLHRVLGSLQPEVAFIQSYYPHLHARLLNATTDQSGTYDVSQLTSAISDMLAEIQLATYLTNLRDELAATICSTSSDMKEKIDSLVQVLLVRLAELASGSMLKKHAPAALSQSVIELHKPQLEAALEEEQARHGLIELIENLSKALNPFHSALTSTIEVSNSEGAINLARYLLTNDREFTTRIGLFFIQQMFEGVVFPTDIIEEAFKALAGGEDERSDYIERSAQTRFWIQLGEKWLNDFSEEATLYLVRLLAESSAPHAVFISGGEQWIRGYSEQVPELHIHWKAYRDQVISNLLETDLFQNPQSTLPPWFTNLSFGLGKAFGKTCSFNLETDQKAEMVQQIVQAVLEEILDHLAISAQGGELDPDKPKATDIVGVLNRLQTKRRITQVLEKWMKTFCSLFLAAPSLLGAKESAALLVGDTEKVATEFNRYLMQTLVKLFKNVEEINWLRLKQISGADVQSLLSALIEGFIHPREDYHVIGIVNGLDLEGENFTVGPIRLFDARSWDYGEANLLDTIHPHAYRGAVEPYASLPPTGLNQILLSSAEYKGFYGSVSWQLVRHGARALTTVHAYDHNMAQELARIKMNQVLDTLTWAYRGRRKDDTGSRLEMLPNYVVIDVKGQSFTQVSGRDSPRLTLLKADENELARYASVYDTLLSQSGSQRTQVEQAAVRAYHWLAKGYWETYKADRFLNYWIALEQLFVQPGERSKLVSISKRLPKLVCTWDRTALGQEILTAWQQLVGEIRSHEDIQAQVDADPNLSEWRENALVVLLNLPLLGRNDPGHRLASLSKLQTLFDPSQLTAAKIQLQEKTRYKIGLLYRRRNVIVHEGYSYSPDMGHFTDTLWELARFAIERVTSRICADIGKHHTIDDVIATYDTPW